MKMAILLNKNKKACRVKQVFLYMGLGLAKCVVLLSELGLLVSRVVLVKKTGCCCLVSLLANELVEIGSNCLISSLNCCIELLDYCLELALNHLVLKCLFLVYKNTLLC